jgi:hypothetical protein
MLRFLVEPLSCSAELWLETLVYSLYHLHQLCDNQSNILQKEIF